MNNTFVLQHFATFPSSANMPLVIPFTPDKLTSCVAILDPATGLVDNGSGGVSSLADQISGTVLVPSAGNSAVFNHGLDATQANQPYLVKGSSGNSLSARIATADFNGNQPFSVMLVGKYLDVAQTGYILGSYNNAGNPGFGGWAINDGQNPANGFYYGLQLFLQPGDGASNSIAVQSPSRSQSVVPITGCFVYVFTYDGSGTAAGIKGYLNGAAEVLIVNKDALAGATIAKTANTVNLGNSFGFNSDSRFYQAAMFNATLTPDQVSLLTTTAKARFGIV